MRLADTVLGMTSRSLETIVDFAMVSISVFGITSVLIAEFYLIRMIQRGLSGRQPGAQRMACLAFMAFVRGPLCGLMMFFFMLPVVIWIPDFEFFDLIKVGVVLTVMGMLAGLICGVAFPWSSPLLGPVLEAVKKWKRGGVWDADFDGPA
jgi:hypothetical protein